MNKYDIKKADYIGKKAIGYYPIFVSNACYNAIEIIDVVYKYGDNIAIYRPVDNSIQNENKPEKIRYSVINEKNCLTVTDNFNKNHCVSFNSFLKY